MFTVAILGCDHEVLAIARALRDDSRFRVVGVYDAEPCQTELQAILPKVTFHAAWEELLVAGPRVVLVGRRRTPTVADDQLRKLVQAGVPLLFTQPPCEAILALELEMIRRDSAAPLAVYYPGCRHETRKLLARIAQATTADSAEPPFGPLEQVLVERHLADRGREAVTRQFACDVHWLETIVGDVRQISALAPGQTGDDLANLNVQMTTQSGSLVRWSVHPRTAGTADTIELIGANTKVELRMPEQGEDWELAGIATYPPPSANEALELLVELALAGDSAGKPTYDVEEWNLAVRSLEVLDSVQVSLKRGRTIELQKTQLSEQHTFKGMMSAAGCLLLLLAPLILVGAALIDRLQASFRPRVTGQTTATDVEVGSPGASGQAESEQGGGSSSSSREGGAAKPRRFPWLAIGLAAPLLVFLLLQTLQLVFPASSPSRRPSSE